ncbi:hypothetical protein ANSO36C_37980 [Nostoc cf. commune SO-36]|uniref:Uncharacterized protein n=1 Tax=Nostoc cf. commune SO-36 TaxID=449208 RepID=A0ABN6Q713_NOSCO|nr:hypothetical protein ANSO36C_37980 [Nostoc cf. commune SO-36]
MKVNVWINQKLWSSIFIHLTSSVEYVGRIRVEHKRCLQQPSPMDTAKLCPERICDKTFNLTTSVSFIT